jgi:hypothetical protein
VGALVARDGDAHRAEERRERESHDALAPVDQGQDAAPSDTGVNTLTFRPARQHPDERALAVPVGDDPVRHARRQIDDGDLQQVADLGALDEDRAPSRRAARRRGVAGDRRGDLDRVGEHVRGGTP